MMDVGIRPLVYRMIALGVIEQVEEFRMVDGFEPPPGPDLSIQTIGDEEDGPDHADDWKEG